MAPKPCAHCGTNFMPLFFEDKTCNNCTFKEKGKKTVKKESTKIKIIIECEPRLQAEIEEICLNTGQDFSSYFLNLHQLSVCKEFAQKCQKNVEEITHEILQEAVLEGDKYNENARRKSKSRTTKNS